MKLFCFKLCLLILSIIFLATCTEPSDPKVAVKKIIVTITAEQNGSTVNAPIKVNVGIALSEVTFTATATEGSPTGSFEISPEAKDGITFDSKGNTATLKGTPTTVFADRPYTVTFKGSNGYGDSKFSVTITSNGSVTLTKTSDTFSVDVNKAMTDIVFTAEGAGTPTGTFSIEPEVSDGLQFSSTENTATISGTPTDSFNRIYTVTFKGSNGYGDSQSSVTIIATKPVTLAATPSTASVDVKTALPNITFTATSSIGTPTGTFSIEPEASDGLQFSATDNTATFGGTPNIVFADRTYTVTYTGSDGYKTVRKSVTIKSIAPVQFTLPWTSASISLGNSFIRDPNDPKPIDVYGEHGEPDGTFSISPSDKGLSLERDAIHTNRVYLVGQPTEVFSEIKFTLSFTGSSYFGNATSSLIISVTPIYDFVHNGHHYKIVNTAKNWEEAAADAAKYSDTFEGYLVEINDSAEQNAIASKLEELKVSSDTVSDGGNGQYAWIGATDKTTEGTWVWDGDDDGNTSPLGTGTGSTWTGTAYQNWGSTDDGSGTTSQNEPDDFENNQDAGAIALTDWPNGSKNQWNDIDMTNSLPYIIEYNFK